MSISVLLILCSSIVCCFSYKHAAAASSSLRKLLQPTIELIDDGKMGLTKNMMFLPDLIFDAGYDDPTLNSLKNYDSFNFNILTLSKGGRENLTFFELANVVKKGIKESGQPIVLMGEGTGALLAAYVSLQVEKNKISKLILLNPIISAVSVFETIMDYALSSHTGSIKTNRMLDIFTATKTIIHDSIYPPTVKSRINYDESKSQPIMKTTKQSIELLQIGKTLMENKWKDIEVPTLVLTINMKKKNQVNPSPLPIQALFPIAFYKLIGKIVNPLDIDISKDRQNDGKTLMNLMKSCENFELKDFTLKYLSNDKVTYIFN